MAEATDILTLAEGKATLAQGTVTSNDTTIATLISAASQRIDRGVGPVVLRVITDEPHDGAGSHLSLKLWPVDSVTTVTEDTVTLTSADYIIDKARGQLIRTTDSDTSYEKAWCRGRTNVIVTYVAGRFGTTADVDSFYKVGCQLLLKHFWRAEQGQAIGIGNADFDIPQIAFPSFGVPNAVTEHFGPSWREKKGGFA